MGPFALGLIVLLRILAAIGFAFRKDYVIAVMLLAWAVGDVCAILLSLRQQ
jgi:hypothetical protein